MKKLKRREVTKFASAHTAPKGANPGKLDLIKSLMHSVIPGFLPQNRKHFYYKSLGPVLVNYEHNS